MLNINSSTSISRLFDQLQADLLQAFKHPAHSVFSSSQILVQSPAMGRWLQLHLAQRHGVVANIEFPMPATFIWQLYTKLLGKQELAHHSSFSKTAMCWRLMNIIDEHAVELPTAVQHYLNANTQQNSQSLQFQFCQNIADVFDQYLVFRPEWIRQWENENIQNAQQNHTTYNQTIANHWQSILWQLLIKYDNSPTSGAHRACLNDLALAHLNSHALVDSLDFKHVFVFGISSLPPQHLSLLHALAQHIDVHFYILNPSQYYFGDIQSRKKQAWLHSHVLHQNSNTTTHLHDLHFCEGNPLLAALGAPIKQFIDQLLEISPQGFNALDDFEDEDTPQEHLLAHMQFEIRQLLFAGKSDSWLGSDIHPNFAFNEDDDSLRVHSCHSRLRELQVVHNQLLNFFANDPTLNPQDVVILAPNPADYAPYLKTVFGHDPQQVGFLPCAISDVSIFSDAPVIKSFFNLLDIGKQRFKASLMHTLIQQPAIYTRWNFNAQEREQITQWITTLGVHWAWDGADKKAWHLPPSHKFTWQNAMQRSLLGLLLDENAGVFEYATQPNLPYTVRSQEQATLWGRWFDFLGVVRNVQTALTQARSVKAWILFLSQLIRDFFSAQDAQETHALLTLQHTLSEIYNETQHSAYEQAVNLDIILSLLKETLAKPQQSFQLIAGQINFSSLLPMRDINFRVVCLLGINDGEYPHPDTQVEFNLMAQFPRQLGDRSRREEDAYQFLQALLSAKDKLHISYIGRSIKDNSPQNPSSFIQELLFYCTQSAYVAAHSTHKSMRDYLFVKHPLFSFDMHYFQNQRALINYSNADFLCAQLTSQDAFIWQRAALDTTQLTLPNNTHNISLDELLHFYKNTAKYFCHSQDIYLENNYKLIEDEEPLQINMGLPRYIYFHHALQAQQQAQNFETWQRIINHQGNTPDARNADIAAYAIWSDAQAALRLAHTESQGSAQTTTFSFTTKKIIFNAQLEIFDERYTHTYKYNDVKPRDKIIFWLNHLAANCTTHNIQSSLFYKSGDKFQALVLKSIDTHTAQQQLNTFIEYYLAAQQGYLAFDARLSYVYAEHLLKTQNCSSAVQKCLKEFSKITDPYTRLLLQADMLEHISFQNLAETLLTPMLEHMAPLKKTGVKK